MAVEEQEEQQAVVGQAPSNYWEPTLLDCLSSRATIRCRLSLSAQLRHLFSKTSRLPALQMRIWLGREVLRVA